METTLIFADAAKDTAEKADTLAGVRKHFERAVSAFGEMIEKLEQGDFAEVNDARRIVQALEKANELALGAKQKADERDKKQRGIAHDYALDFAAARSEVGRRLACLRTGGGASGVSE